MTSAVLRPGPEPTPNSLLDQDTLKRDVIIIGGGPSGLSTALHIARDFPALTSRILILEKARYPRSKLCAGGLVLDAEVILQRLGLDVREIPRVDVEDIHFDFQSKGLNIRMPSRHALRVIRREEFDNWLAEKARKGNSDQENHRENLCCQETYDELIRKFPRKCVVRGRRIPRSFQYPLTGG